MKTGNSSRRRLVVVLAFAFSVAIVALGWLKAQNFNDVLYIQINLVSSGYVNAEVVDPNLVNPWGVAASPTSPLWISNQVTNTSTLYSINNVQMGTGSPFVVAIPATTTGSQGPTGQVFNAGTGFPIPAASGTVPSHFIFANLNGTISGWNPGSTGGLASAVIAVSTPGASYTGLAVATVPVPTAVLTSPAYLYAADFTPPPDGGIKVFDSSFNPVNFGPNAFIDPQLPALPANEAWEPYNVANLGGNLYVAYAPLPLTGGLPVSGDQNGVIAEFTTAGTFMSNITKLGLLNDPWGMVMAPAHFGRYSNDLLVGNFGDGKINAYRVGSDGLYFWSGVLRGPDHQILKNGALWSLWFGNGANGANATTLYFTTGGPDENVDGLLGAISPMVPD